MLPRGTYVMTADPGDAAMLTHSLPDQPGAADLSDGREYEQSDGTQHGHADQRNQRPGQHGDKRQAGVPSRNPALAG